MVSSEAALRFALTGCGKTLRNCHSERSEESGPERFQEDTQSEILRCAQDDTRGAFFRSLLSPSSADFRGLFPAPA